MLWASTTPTQPAEARGPDCRSTLPNLPLSVHCQDLLQHKLWARQLQHNPLKPEAQTAVDIAQPTSLSVHCQDLLQHKLWASTTPTQPAEARGPDCRSTLPNLLPQCALARISCSTNYGRSPAAQIMGVDNSNTTAEARGPDCRSTLPNYSLSVHCQDLLQHKLWASTTPTQPAEARGPDCRSTLPNLPLSVHCQDLLQHKLWASTTPTQPAEARGPDCRRHCPTYSLSVHCQDLCSTNYGRRQLQHNPLKPEARLPVDIAQLLPQCALPGSPAAQSYGRRQLQHNPLKPEARLPVDIAQPTPQCALPGSPAAQNYGRQQLQHNPLKPEAQTAGRHCPTYSLSVHCQDLLQHKLWASTTPTQPAEARGPDCRSTLPNLLPQCALPGSPAAHNYGRRQLQHNPLKPEAQTAGRNCPTYSLSVHCPRISCST
ncbi:hypothetical protein JTE90_013822 [Oedothorax gibbosus]|uniref:Uncharacterized protein n=1 Tax=Oedothorax gibbosus TaxID=931172 RepID=A0AAV6VKC7_9ARAC|nr:hypothetical protein JTE90_013822 [Oedothorax gibbosus]